MIIHSLKLAFRNLLRHKGYAFINIFGLAIGLAACMIIFLYLNHEWSFDQFHSQKERIYRLTSSETQEDGGIRKTPNTPFPIAPALAAAFPEIEKTVRLMNWDGVSLSADGTNITMVDQLFETDPAFFEVFDFEMLHGSKKTALTAPSSIVVTASTAIKFFGKTDVIGKSLRYGPDKYNFNITGVLQDLPLNSHLQFDGLVSIGTFDYSHTESDWRDEEAVAYILLENHASQEELASKFPTFLNRHQASIQSNSYQLHLQLLSEIHLNSMGISHDHPNFRKGNQIYIYIFSILALFVLLIASINFTNLATARTAKRAKEVGVRKSIGAKASQIAGQFLVESVFFASLSMFFALLLTETALPLLNELIDREIVWNFESQPWLIPGIAGMALLTGLIAGIYPSWILSSLQTVKAIKGEIYFRNRKISLQNLLIVVQFTISIILIVGTLLSLQQINYLQTKSLGFEENNLVLLKVNDKIRDQYPQLKSTLLTHPEIKGVTLTSDRLGENIRQATLVSQINGQPSNHDATILRVDETFVDVYQTKVVEGRNFSSEFGTDSSNAFLINEAFARQLGSKGILGSQLSIQGGRSPGTIIGIVNDFHFHSLYHSLDPLVIQFRPESSREMAIRITGNSLGGTLDFMEKVWATIGTSRPFQPVFLDQHMASMYQSDVLTSKIISLIAVLVVIIAALGFLGLAALKMETRLKEISIRRILGASVPSILRILSLDFLQIVLIALFIAIPISWFMMEEWLSQFAYRIEIGFAVFVFAGFIALLIASSTILYRAWGTLKADPATILRND